MVTIVLLLFSISFGATVDVLVKNPPPHEETNATSCTRIPTVDGRWRKVKSYSAMNNTLLSDRKTNINVIFELYTLRNPTKKQLLTTGYILALFRSNLDPNRPTRIVIHGWYTDGSMTSIFQQAYFMKGQHDVNLIVVNWQDGSNTINYYLARMRIPIVGPVVAAFVDFLVKYGRIDPEKLIVIGHSLGAHVAGLVGKQVTFGKLPLIIALDPAKPLFSLNSPDERVAIGDARSVEVIHTAAGLVGFSAPLGNVSFYPNGGSKQPGCGWWDIIGTCAHGRAIVYYAESINSRVGFNALKCNSYAEIKQGLCKNNGEIIQMGENPNASGVYYLETSESIPFAMGEKWYVKD